MIEGQPTKRGSGPEASSGQTVLTYPVVDRLVIFLGIPAGAFLVAALLPPLGRWVLGLSTGFPMRPVFRLLGAIDSPREWAVHLVIFLVVGLGVTWAAVTESAKVTLTDDEVRLDIGDRTQTIARADIDAVFLDGKTLVVLDRESRQLFCDSPRASRAALAKAFRAHGYPWQDADPYAEMYRRWVSDTPDLPPAVNAVLAARETALKKKAGQQVRELRDAVEELGFVVRDEGARQYWRGLVRA